MVMLSELESLPEKACRKGIISKSVTNNICGNASGEASRPRRILTMTTRT